MNKLIDEKFLKFIIVGIVNTLAGMTVMFCLYNLFGCSYWVSSAANYILVSLLSYGLNKKFTFRHEGELLGSGVRFACNIAVCYLAAYGIAKPLTAWIMESSSLYLQENMAMLVGMCIFTGLNYAGQRFFVFREEMMEYRKIYEEWLASPYVSDAEKARLSEMKDEEIYEAFYQYAEFGTAGMRGIMGLGTNRLNKYTIRMAAKGLGQLLGKGAKVVIAYDTRNHSVEFAEETAKTLAAMDIKVWMFDRYSPVPLLSYAVRELGCDGGVVITASHNTKEYNGFKVYDNTGCQMNESMAGQIAANIAALSDGLAIEAADMDHENIVYVGDALIEGFMDAVRNCSTDIDAGAVRDLKIVYTSLHGSGRDFVMKALECAGFEDITLVQQQADHNGDFPTVKKPNPEDKAAFAMAEEIAVKQEADILIGTDPDCDRIGVGVRRGNQVTYLTGNQTGVLLIDFLARQANASGKKMITTIVTSDMGKTAAESYGVDVIKTFTGFKNIGAVMNQMDDDAFLMGYEESYGYLPGTHARDKDGVSSALVICQMAAWWKAQDKSLTDALEMLYQQHGYWIDHQESFTFEGSKGVARIADIMEIFRRENTELFKDVGEIEAYLDYQKGIDGFPPANVLKFICKGGSWIAIRPSGTEPKIKFYYCITGASEQAARQMYDRARTCVNNVVRD